MLESASGRQNSNLLQRRLAGIVKIVERALESELREKHLHLGIDRLRLVAEAEERFGAAEKFSAPRDRENFVDRHRLRAGFVRRFAERAVAAEIAAEVCERDENLGRERDRSTFMAVAQRRRRFQQLFQLIAARVGQTQRLRARRRFAVANVIRKTIGHQCLHSR